jgi:hypothetical protein
MQTDFPENERKMNNTAKGNQFRSHVLGLLKTKYPDATTEMPVSWKNADIVFTGMDFGRRIRFAVECKNYERKLKTDDFRKILGDYDAAFKTQEIHTLIVISKHDIEAASRKLVDDSPRVRFMTYNELEEWLIGLRCYIEHLSKEFIDDEVHAYYIDGRFVGHDEPAFDMLRTWISTSSTNGLAILGGYGLGKSSLAKRFAADQARRYLENPAGERMPILLKLGQVIHETELSGLFGKQFTDQHFAEGYSFRTLMHLNELGRLVVILDGFDEMKHAMTEADFKSNFREFNKLRTDNSKVLLLGRPSAFTSESADLLIKGIGRMGGQPYVDEDFPAWTEMTLAFFTREEAKEFLLRFLAHSARKQVIEPNAAAIEGRVLEVMTDVHNDILERPVQTRIVGQLAATPEYKFKDINRFKLYNDFIEKVIERDQEKRARKKIPRDQRRTFLEELAWWAWTRGNSAQGVFRKDEVPQTIFDQLSNGDAIDVKSKRSEYLVSSLTEHKDSDVLYFAHRSFQEFLVASWIASRRAEEQNQLLMINRALTPEVNSFLREVEDTTYLQHLYPQLIQRLRGEISVDLLMLMRLDASVRSTLTARNALQLTIFDPLIVAYKDTSIAPYPIASFAEWLCNTVRAAPIATADSALWCLLRHATSDNQLMYRALAAGWERVLTGINHDGVSQTAIIVEQQHFGSIGEVLRTFCKKDRNIQGRRLRWAHDDAVNEMEIGVKRLGIDVPIVLHELSNNDFTVIDSLLMETHMSPDSVKLFGKIYAAKGDAFNLVCKIEKQKTSLRGESQ